MYCTALYCTEIKPTQIVIDNFQETPQKGSGVYTFRVTFGDDNDIEDDNNENAPVEPPSKLHTKSPTKSPTEDPTVSPTKNPTKVPTNSFAKSPTNGPTKAPTTGSPTTQSPTKIPTSESPTRSTNTTLTTPIIIDESECSHIVRVNITTDLNPNETTWEIISATTGRYLTGYRLPEDLDTITTTTSSMKNSLQNYTEYDWKICVSGLGTSLFRFHIYDTGLDGLQPPGKYSLSLDGELIATGGVFTGGLDTIEFSTTETNYYNH